MACSNIDVLRSQMVSSETKHHEVSELIRLISTRETYLKSELTHGSLDKMAEILQITF